MSTDLLLTSLIHYRRIAVYSGARRPIPIYKENMIFYTAHLFHFYTFSPLAPPPHKSISTIVPTPVGITMSDNVLYAEPLHAAVLPLLVEHFKV